MSAPRAICIRCGTTKRRAKTACGHCGFRPTSDIDVARSIYLSSERFFAAEPHPAWEAQMQEAQQRLRAAEPVWYDEGTLQEILATKALVRSVPWWSPVGALLKLWIPIVVVIAALLLVRWLRGQ
jgi:hypothetical protein